MEIYDECNNLRCRARWHPWRFRREPGGRWYLCFSGHPVVRFRALPGGRLEFDVDHWWSLLIMRFPRQERLLYQGTVRQVRPAQLKLTWATRHGAVSLYLIGQPLDLLRTGRSPIQIETEGFGSRN